MNGPWYHAISLTILIPTPARTLAMDEATVSELFELKTAIRKQAHENRRGQSEKDSVSNAIVDRFMNLPEYHSAKTIMFYVDVRDEVRTRQALPAALESGKTIVVPYCVDGELELFWLENMDELELGMYRILEPKNELRIVESKRPQPTDLDLVMVPGVAFDRNGGRTGHGKGYYDKLLQHARLDAPLIALAFECQIFEKIPAESHDIYMDKIVTETAVYTGKGR
ncbi:MAG TPA: 5-formyltetrahydrofolate cyclo-ligase [Pirellula sp.]|nr:5-formyltetrahydrofolate cyclo-ligase [Pirellula sp.]